MTGRCAAATPASLCVLVATCLASLPSSAFAGPNYFTWQHTSYENTCQVSGGSHSKPCCTVDGWDGTGDNVTHPKCPTLISTATVATSCATDRPLDVEPRVQCPIVCSCGDQGNPFCGGWDVTQHPDKSIDPGTYQCDKNTSPGQPEQCDGLSAGTVPVDQGCGSDEHQCNIGDSDPAPVRYSSGRVESNPITLFSVTTPDDILFGYRIMYNSQVMRTAAQRNTVNAIHDEFPVIHHSEEDTHHIGLGWLDNFSDRLYVTAPNTPSSRITWMSQNGTVTFINTAGAWKSWSGKFELINRGGAANDGLGRWVIRTIDPAAPRQLWSFEEIKYWPYDGSPQQTLGRLRRRAVLTSDLSDLAGRYGFTVTWNAKGQIDHAIDTLGRRFTFVYKDEIECLEYDPQRQPPDDCARSEVVSTRLVAVHYLPSANGPDTTIANLQFTPFPNNDRLERVERPSMAGYTRFLYQRAPSGGNCVHCNALLTDVIVPGDAATSTPGPSVAALASEIVTEHDDYGRGANPAVPSAVHSQAPGREYAYEYGVDKTTQFDLHQDGGVCGAGNSCATPGYACRTVGQISPHCYVADVMKHDTSTGLATSHLSAGAATPNGGNANAFSRSYTATGAPKSLTDASGMRTTYGYDSLARLRCIVQGDNDTQAFSDPAHPDTSTCAGPATPATKVVQIDYGSSSVTTTTPGVLGGSTTRVETVNPVTLLQTASTTSGLTKDINGTLHPEVHTILTGHDELGREVFTNGPLDDAIAYDATATAYYSTTDPDWPYNLGQIRSVTRFVGTIASNVRLTTTYAEYDLFGVPRRVTDPTGAQLVYASSPDRLNWAISAVDRDGSNSLVTTVVFNPNGTVRSQRDADGICVTFEYADATGYVGAPTVIRRSNTDCGTLPIDKESGEVEIRTYFKGERDRLESITRKTNGVVELSYAGFTYDRNRRLISSSTANSDEPFTYGSADVLLSSVSAPGGPAQGAWRTAIAADALGRPSKITRFVDTANGQTYGYGYSSVWSSSPSSMTRGYNGGATTVTSFVYDDFGRLLEVSTPDLGRPTRYEYDLADRLVRRRDGIGTPEVNTTEYTYDSLGRTTYVAHAVERPVTCGEGGAPAGTPIQDEEYAYDFCSPTDRPEGTDCANALGRLTLSRSIEQCGTTGSVIKRGRWYSYDLFGRVSQVAYATSNGSVIGAPAVMTYSYDAVGRLEAYTSPLNTAFGARFQYGPTDGRIASVTTTSEPGAPIAHDLTYRAFGDLVSYVTGSTQVVTGGARTLQVTNTYRGDDTLIGVARTYVGEGTTSSIDLVQQVLGYTPAGLLRYRDDAADAVNSRHYEYDTLQRLTCEVRNGGTSADCASISQKLVSLFRYGDGQTAVSPPDTRLSAVIRATSGQYTSEAAEAYSYAGGNGRPLSVSRSDGNIVLGYDGLGRRIFEYQAVSSPDGQVLSRRDYAYLPSGQLGQIRGWTPAGDPYTVTIRYDAEGRPNTVAYNSGDTYELFWDDMGRLIAASIEGARNVRWSYHYAGETLVAATRETVGPTTSVKRFWPVSDERGLILRMVDEDGATHWQAHWDATAWRSLDGTPQPDMWVPFGLPGQLILEHTEASPNASATSVRPSIVINHLRAYDPLFGGFLQPDPADQSARLLPEGYLLARGDYLGHVDESGARSKIRDEYNKLIPPGWELRFDASCGDWQQNKIRVAIDQAIQDIDKCHFEKCGAASFGASLKRQWIFALLTGAIYCGRPMGHVETPLATNMIKSDIFGKLTDSRGNRGLGITEMYKEGVVLGGRPTVLASYQPCLKNTVAHEAMHSVYKTFPLRLIPGSEPAQGWGAGQLYYGSMGDWTMNKGGTVSEHDGMQPYLDTCINCGTQ